eukprot:gnl/TRDRNA2_/TRDRNA2_131947_c1_seq1.p1 gnl/TRDRNA2_/TRDRNA2_131947_c1~~gnl/TRDRNA2_/TRDRNA2_131947_c1_seq1.p1  ORF type:complete len:137 (+),score=18.99 gnl/TRDRNA2_/TRDRNA2_131947_c1_seq1:1-411(+)
MMKRLAQPPLTLVHGDFHPGNVRFSTDSPPIAAAFDWQFCCRCRGSYDFAYFITLFAPREVRQKCENDLAKCYLAAAERPSGDAAEFINDVRAALLVVMSFFLMVNLHALRNGTILHGSIKKIGHALDDWGCSALL